jgi:hypothetical protein
MRCRAISLATQTARSSLERFKSQKSFIPSEIVSFRWIELYSVGKSFIPVETALDCGTATTDCQTEAWNENPEEIPSD